MKKTISIKTLGDWQLLAQAVISLLKPGSIICLSGPLGAGKTTFVQALAQKLGSTKTPKSPTFSLLRSYKIKTAASRLTRLVHIDAYRIEHEKDLVPLDLEQELTEPGTILAIEWPENIRGWLKPHAAHCINIKISLQKNGSRQASLSASRD